MLQSIKRWYVFIFTIGILIIADTIQSGAVVDRSFLPRFTLVSVFLLIIWIGRKQNITIQLTLFTLSFILFYCWNLLSSFWAISGPEALMQSQLVFVGLVTFLIVSDFSRNDEEFENIFIKSLFFTLVYSFALAFYQMYRLEFYDPYKVTSICANNNLYSGFLLLSIPFLINGYSKNKGVWKYLLLLAGIFSIFFILILQTRAVYIGLFISVSLLFFIVLLRYGHIFTKRNILVGVASSVLLILMTLTFYFSLDTTRKSYFKSKLAVLNYVSVLGDEESDSEKYSSLHSADNSPEFDLSASYYQNANLRVIFWKKSLGLIKSNPVLGVGAGNWKISVSSVKNPPNPEHTLRNYTYSQPHNEWICIASELGITGLMLALLLFVIPVILIFIRIVRAKSAPIAAVIYASLIVGFYVYSIFDFPLRRVEHNILFFSAMAFLMQYTPLKTVKSDVFEGIPKRIFFICVALLLVFSLVLAIARMQGEYYTISMFRNERKNDSKTIYFSRKAENIFYKITPNALPLDWFEGVALFRLGDINAANSCFAKALKSTPYEVRVLNDYGASFFQLQKTREAKAALIQCVDIDSNFDDALFNLSAIYFFAGQRDSARFYVNKCRESQKKQDFLKELN